MAAGRCSDGQVIIPLTYTLPVIVLPESAVNTEISGDISVFDLINDPATEEIGNIMLSCGTNQFDSIFDGGEYTLGDMTGWLSNSDRFPYLLGSIADLQNEEMLITEDELYEDLCNIRDNITEFSFKNKFDNMLKDLAGSMQSDLMMNGTYDTSAVPEIYDIINRSLHE